MGNYFTVYFYSGMGNFPSTFESLSLEQCRTRFEQVKNSSERVVLTHFDESVPELEILEEWVKPNGRVDERAI